MTLIFILETQEALSYSKHRPIFPLCEGKAPTKNHLANSFIFLNSRDPPQPTKPATSQHNTISIEAVAALAANTTTTWFHLQFKNSRSNQLW